MNRHILLILMMLSVIGCGFFGDRAGTTEETETGTPIALMITIPEATANARIMIYKADGTFIRTLNRINDSTFTGMLPPGEYFLWAIDGDDQALSHAILQNQETSLTLRPVVTRDLSTAATTNPPMDLSGTICTIRGTGLSDTLDWDSLLQVANLSLLVPDTVTLLQCILKDGVHLSYLLDWRDSTLNSKPLVFVVPIDTTSVDSNQSFPEMPIPLDSFYLEAAGDLPQLAIVRPTWVSIPANRDEYFFTAIKVAKEPKTFLTLHLWSEGGHYLEVPGGLWGDDIPTSDADGDGRLWIILEPVLGVELDMPVQFDWW